MISSGATLSRDRPDVSAIFCSTWGRLPPSTWPRIPAPGPEAAPSRKPPRLSKMLPSWSLASAESSACAPEGFAVLMAIAPVRGCANRLAPGLRFGLRQAKP